MFSRLHSILVSSGLAALLGLAALGVGPAHAGAPPEEESPLERVDALVQPSIVYLQQDWAAYIFDKANKTYLNGGQQFELSFQCTGFVVNPDGYIATAGHCVDLDEVKPAFFETAAQWAVDNGYYLSSTLTVADIVGFQDYRVETMEEVNRADLVIQVGWGAAASGIQTAEVRRARVVGFRAADAGDVALLKVEATGLNALPLSDADVDVGTEVVSIGYPASVDSVTDPDLTPSFKDGSISSVKTVQGGILPVYEISAAVSGGMSGGPTVDLDGDVVGVNSFGIVGESQPFNFVRPSSQLAELLAGAGVENLMSDTTIAYRDGLAAYWDGDKETAVAKLAAVVDDQPSNELAAEYLDKAEALPEPPVKESDSDLPLVPIVLGSVAAVAVAAGVVVTVLLLRRRGRRAPGGVATTVAPATAGAPSPLTPFPPPLVPAGGPPAGPPTEPSAGPPAEPPAVPLGFSSPVAQAPPAVPVHEPHFCGSCGDPAEPGTRFCTNCGHPLA